MSKVTDVRSLTDHPFQRLIISDVVIALGTTFGVETYGDFEYVSLLNKDFIIFVQKYIPALLENNRFDDAVALVNAYHLNRLQYSLHHQLRELLAEVVYGPLVYTCSCEHVNDALDCIDFNAVNEFEKDAFDTAVQNGEIVSIINGLMGMVNHVEKVYHKSMVKRENREWIFENDTMIKGVHKIEHDDILRIAESIQLEFDTHYASTAQYINEILMKKYFPVDLPALHTMMLDDVEKMVAKGRKMEYADFCDFVAKYNLYKTVYE